MFGQNHWIVCCGAFKVMFGIASYLRDGQFYKNIRGLSHSSSGLLDSLILNFFHVEVFILKFFS